jgi:riboflavin transporter FmnP
MERNRSQLIAKMSTLGILSALGVVLMIYGSFPYIPAPWNKFDFSDTVVLVAYALYGFSGAFITALLKTLISLLTEGAIYSTYGVGQVAAFSASMCYILGLFFFSHVLKWFKKGLGFRLASYGLTAVFVSVVMTLLNMLFITPSFAAQKWTTCFESGLIDSIETNYASLGNSYFAIITVIYLPFNLLKALMITLTYEVVFNRVIFVLFPRNKFVSAYFLGPLRFKKEEKKEKNEKKPDTVSASSDVLTKVYSEEKEHEKTSSK